MNVFLIFWVFFIFITSALFLAVELLALLNPRGNDTLSWHVRRVIRARPWLWPLTLLGWLTFIGWLTFHWWF